MTHADERMTNTARHQSLSSVSGNNYSLPSSHNAAVVRLSPDVPKSSDDDDGNEASFLPDDDVGDGPMDQTDDDACCIQTLIDEGTVATVDDNSRQRKRPAKDPYPFGKCQVCGLDANGVHYGVESCEGCKGFYRRSVRIYTKFKCKSGGDCLGQTPLKCRYCRFHRCVQLGMKFNSSRMGRIPKHVKAQGKAPKQHACGRNVSLTPTNSADSSPPTTTGLKSAFPRSDHSVTAPKPLMHLNNSSNSDRYDDLFHQQQPTTISHIMPIDVSLASASANNSGMRQRGAGDEVPNSDDASDRIATLAAKCALLPVAASSLQHQHRGAEPHEQIQQRAAAFNYASSLQPPSPPQSTISPAGGYGADRQKQRVAAFSAAVSPASESSISRIATTHMHAFSPQQPPLQPPLKGVAWSALPVSSIMVKNVTSADALSSSSAAAVSDCTSVMSVVADAVAARTPPRVAPKAEMPTYLFSCQQPPPLSPLDAEHAETTVAATHHRRHILDDDIIGNDVNYGGLCTLDSTSAHIADATATELHRTPADVTTGRICSPTAGEQQPSHNSSFIDSQHYVEVQCANSPPPSSNSVAANSSRNNSGRQSDDDTNSNRLRLFHIHAALYDALASCSTTATTSPNSNSSNNSANTQDSDIIAAQIRRTIEAAITSSSQASAQYPTLDYTAKSTGNEPAAVGQRLTTPTRLSTHNLVDLADVKTTPASAEMDAPSSSSLTTPAIPLGSVGNSVGKLIVNLVKTHENNLPTSAACGVFLRQSADDVLLTTTSVPSPSPHAISMTDAVSGTNTTATVHGCSLSFYAESSNSHAYHNNNNNSAVGMANRVVDGVLAYLRESASTVIQDPLRVYAYVVVDSQERLLFQPLFNHSVILGLFTHDGTTALHKTTRDVGRALPAVDPLRLAWTTLLLGLRYMARKYYVNKLFLDCLHSGMPLRKRQQTPAELNEGLCVVAAHFCQRMAAFVDSLPGVCQLPAGDRRLLTRSSMILGWASFKSLMFEHNDCYLLTGSGMRYNLEWMEYLIGPDVAGIVCRICSDMKHMRLTFAETCLFAALMVLYEKQPGITAAGTIVQLRAYYWRALEHVMQATRGAAQAHAKLEHVQRSLAYCDELLNTCLPRIESYSFDRPFGRREVPQVESEQFIDAVEKGPV